MLGVWICPTLPYITEMDKLLCGRWSVSQLNLEDVYSPKIKVFFVI